jgi:carboxypeptidase T
MKRILLIAASFLFVGGGFARAENQTPYEKIKDRINQIAKDYPQNATVFVLGDSDAGDNIIGLQIGHGATNNLVVGTHHGNEYGATEVATGFAAELAKNPIADQTIYVIPVLNISGYNSNERRETAKGTTFDPNRDYPGPCGTEGPYNLHSTANLAHFIDEKNIVASATLHTFYPAVTYPWGLTTQDLVTPYEDMFLKLVQAATVESQYSAGNTTQLIYPANGSFEDYAYWKHGIWSILFEIGNTHTPNESEVQELVRVNVPGLMRMLNLAPKTRAPNHDFIGKCDAGMSMMDLHIE